MNNLRITNRRSRGFTLIEVLVTMLILAVGLLGVAALQLKGLQFNHDASLRSRVSLLAYDIAERMRASEMLAGQAVEYILPAAYTVSAARPSCTDAEHKKRGLTAADVVTDRQCWYQHVHDLLPPGSTVNITGAGNEYTVTLGWTDREGQSHNIEYTFVL